MDDPRPAPARPVAGPPPGDAPEPAQQLRAGALALLELDAEVGDPETQRLLDTFVEDAAGCAEALAYRLARCPAPGRADPPLGRTARPG